MNWPTGNFHVDEDHPKPYGICDRCGFMWGLADLRTQSEWRGNRLVELKGLLICPDCVDVPNEQGRTIRLPPDPVPVKNPRPIPQYQQVQAEAWDAPLAVWDDDVSEWDA